MITVGKFVAFYSIVIGSLVWIFDVFVKWSVPHLLELLFLLIVPSFVSGPLIYVSRRKLRGMNRWLFVVAAEFHLVFVTLVIVYEVFQLDDVAQRSMDAMAVSVMFGSLVLAVMLYRRIRSLTRPLEN